MAGLSFDFWTWVFFILFIGVSSFHLLQCFLENKKYADVTKAMLMPFLLLFFIFYNIENSLPKSFASALVITALCFSALGDVSLIFDSKKIFFIFGMLFFAVTQISYIIFAVLHILKYSFPFIQALIAGGIFVIALTAVFYHIGKFLGDLKWAVLFYGIFICTMSLLFVISAFSAPAMHTVLPAVGSLIFVVSDTMVAYQQFAAKIKKGRFYVMFTYITAQMLIVLGISGILSSDSILKFT